jgi:chromosome segregation ATPase
MENVSLWKRVGGWLQRSSRPQVAGELVNLDAEGLLMDPQGHPGNDGTAVIVRGSKQQQMVAMEEGFNRLVKVMESIDENVTIQRGQGAELNSHIKALAEAMGDLPDGVQKQSQAINAMASEIKGQSLRYQQFSETIKVLPQQGKEQVDKLNAIADTLGSSLENQAVQIESFNKFDNTVQGILEGAQAQSASLANIGRMLEQNQQCVREMLDRQSRRFVWLWVGLFGVALAMAAAMIWFATGQ